MSAAVDDDGDDVTGMQREPSSTIVSENTSKKPPKNPRTSTTTSGRARRRPGIFASLLVVLAVLVANASYLTGLRSNDPVLYHSGLGSPTPGYTELPQGGGNFPYTIDANDGWTVQALGRAAAQAWAHGSVPLWNLFEGLGQPLAGEQQSAALFQPFVMLHLLPNGPFFMHLVLELIAGLTMLGFLRSLRLSWTAATVGGVLFGVNGVFSIMTNAPFNPIAFLPMVLWGVEMIAARVGGAHGSASPVDGTGADDVDAAEPDVQRSGRPRLGIAVVALGLAWMLCAGFPETALIQGYLIAAWVLVRTLAMRGRRLRFLGWSALGALLGVMLSAPNLVALKHFLGFAYTAYHDGGEVPPWRYAPAAFYGLFAPFVSGPFGDNPLTGGVAGYITLTSLMCAVVGLLGRRPRAIKVLLVALVAVLMLNMFGVKAVNTVLNAVPGMTLVLTYKYGIILLVFAFTLLTAYGVDDLSRGRVQRRTAVIALTVALAYVVAALLYRRTAVSEEDAHGLWVTIATVLLVLACAVLAAALMLGRTRDGRSRRFAPLPAGVVLAVEAVVSFSVPAMNASPPAPIDTAPVTYLQRHLGTSRFFTLGPIQPNYGSYWNLAEFNVNDLPVPKKFADYVVDGVRPPKGSPADDRVGLAFAPYLLVTRNYDVPTETRLLRAYGQQQAAYRNAGVRFLVTAPGVVSTADASRYGLRKVLTSTKTEIFEDAAARPYYDTAGACHVSAPTRESVSLDCSRPTTLTRAELSTTGWSATITTPTGSSTKILPSRDAQLFQKITVPAGSSQVRFAFHPPHWRAAVGVSLLALVLVIGQLVLPWPRRRRGGPQAGDDRGLDDGAATIAR